jgi:hypothetical protein
MSDGLTTTFSLLTKTDNRAAVRVLIPALDSPQPQICEGALTAILKRRSLTGGREILRRLHELPDNFKEIIRQHPGRLSQTLRDAILGSDRQMMLNACQAAVWFREYDLIATLLTVLEDSSTEASHPAGDTLLLLAAELYNELASERDYAIRRDPQLVRKHVVASLEDSVKRYANHQRREVIEAFVLLVGRDNVTLKQILQDAHHTAFLATVDVLSHSNQAGAIRLLLSFLDDPHAPSAALGVIAKRSDERFVQYLLRKIGREPAAMVTQNLKRIEAIPWLREDDQLLDRLDDAGQHGVVRLAMCSGIPRSEAFALVKHLLRHGRPGGRREAADALTQFAGTEANQLALSALDDPDPQVQANAVGQLRSRNIPGVLARLIEMVDSPHEVVRRAAREGLDEFSFERFVRAFDMLDDEVRQSTGMLVKKIDPRTLPQLQEQLQSRVRTRRIRGLAIARSIDLVDRLEDLITELLCDEDHRVRVEAATALARGVSSASYEALKQALHDSSPAVQEASEESLHVRSQTAS